MLYKNSKITILQGNITEIKVDAIVNAANNTLLGGSGVDGAIHRVGGPTILEQCIKIGGCPTGEARITTGGNLPSDYIIHTVGPIYNGDDIDEKLLYNAYYNSLLLAMEYNLKSIAFPAISTGAYNYPKEEACDIAIKAVTNFIENNDYSFDLYFILFDNKNYNIYQKKLKELFG